MWQCGVENSVQTVEKYSEEASFNYAKQAVDLSLVGATGP